MAKDDLAQQQVGSSDNSCLFRRNELEERFSGSKILGSCHQTFPAPEGTRKDFSLIIGEKPSQKIEEFFKQLESHFIAG